MKKSTENPKGIVHIINGLGKISGAENSMLRVVKKQKVRPLVIISLHEVARHDPALTDLPDDVSIYQFHGPIGLLGGTIRLIIYLARQRSMTIVCWMYRSNFIAGIASIFVRHHRLIWNVRHSLMRHESEPMRVKLSIWLNKFFCSLPSQIVYNSRRACEQHEAYGFPAEKSAYVPNGFDKVTPSKSQTLEDGCLVIGHAGRLTWEKDIETLIAAFASARERAKVRLKLIMVGTGYENATPEFCALLKRYGVDDGSVEGRGKTNDMHSFYNEIDIFALSSISEGFPNVLAEAQLYAVPCITTDVGDAVEIVEPDFGWIVDANNPVSFANAILKAGKLSATSITKMGDLAKLHTEKHFSIDKVVTFYDAVGVSQ